MSDIFAFYYSLKREWPTIGLLLMLPQLTIAQREASHWFFGEQAGLFFSCDTVVVQNGATDFFFEGCATISDKEGNLQFYMTGEKIWNRLHLPMQNSGSLMGHTSSAQSSIIVPHPGDTALYYAITTGASDHGNNTGLMYHMIDMRLDEGKGAVVMKNKLLFKPSEEALTAVADYSTGTVWVVSPNRDERSLYAYKIDKNGIHKTPVVKTFEEDVFNFFYMKFSPSGNKLAIGLPTVEEGKVGIYNFDKKTGQFSNFQMISLEGLDMMSFEFSSNSRFLYVSAGKSIIESSENVYLQPFLYQYDLDKTTEADIIASKVLIKEFDKEDFLARPQLGLDGKIYLAVSDQSFLSVINYPDKPGLDCGYEENKINLGDNIVYINFPNFITSYFDTIAQNSERIVIVGSRSVCPSVEEVSYQVEPYEAGFIHQWIVEGGEIVKGQNTPSILVNWGPTNFNAKVRMISYDKVGCPRDSAIFPVRIKVELDTETPRGEDSICTNNLKNHRYAVTNTNGSVYTWGVAGGTIRDGQGTHLVTIDWGQSPPHQVWVQEQSITRDTVCFGVSDTLSVTVIEDSITSAIVHAVSVDSQAIGVIWKINALGNITHPVELLRRKKGEIAWKPVVTLSHHITSYIDAIPDVDQDIYEYSIQTLNYCGEYVTSSIHNTILLSGTTNEDENQIMLTWNSYEGWKEGVFVYELWRKVDEDTFQLVEVLEHTQLDAILYDGDIGFDHHFKIKAVSNDGETLSWSNELQLSFEHQLYIPNVITPNDDNKNDSFQILHIELYPQNELVIVNRQGKEVYRKRGYHNEFAGADLSTGIYFYSLFLEGRNKTYKGWLQILR